MKWCNIWLLVLCIFSASILKADSEEESTQKATDDSKLRTSIIDPSILGGPKPQKPPKFDPSSLVYTAVKNPQINISNKPFLTMNIRLNDMLGNTQYRGEAIPDLVCKPLKSRQFLDLLEQKSKQSKGRSDCQAKFYRDHNFKRRAGTLLTSVFPGKEYNRLPHSATGTGYHYIQSVGSRKCDYPRYVMACTEESLKGKCVISNKDAHISNLDRFGFRGEVKSFKVCNSVLSCANSTSVQVQTQNKKAPFMILPCYEHLRHYDKATLEKAMTEILGFLYSHSPGLYYQEYHLYLDDLLYFWAMLKKQKDFLHPNIQLASYHTQSEVKDVLNDIENIEKEIQDLEKISQHTKGLYEEIKTIKSKFNSRKEFLEDIRKKISEVESLENNDIEAKLRAMIGLKYYISSQADELRQELDQSRVLLYQIGMQTQSLKAQLNTLSETYSYKRIKKRVKKLNTALDKINGQSVLLTEKVTKFLPKISNVVIKHHLKIDNILNNPDVNVQNDLSVNIHNAIKEVHNKLLYKKIADEEASLRFIDHINSLIIPTQKQPPQSKFMNIPYLLHYYYDLKKLTDYAVICTANPRPWMKTGCQVLVDQDAKVKRIIDDLPSMIESSLIALEELGDSQDLKRIESLLWLSNEDNTHGKLRDDWRDNLSSALAAHDIIIKQKEALK